ncbi:hypothetical protein [Psychrobacter sp. I-STPA6b]|uniref:hypothetical protein n=1 Tax=Psychrobacter sp. I-STPA6b TaxID=2585718 RepID=UPI001D0C3605|nr:hypothetical protein [Psychrobacter sp. I-STPA6b]
MNNIYASMTDWETIKSAFTLKTQQDTYEQGIRLFYYASSGRLGNERSINLAIKIKGMSIR